LSAGAQAWLDPDSGQITCLRCAAPPSLRSGERHVTVPLDGIDDVGVLVLHQRSAPATRGTIDHVVVAVSGVWVVASKYHAGKVARRDGTDPPSRPLLFVGKHNVTGLVDDLRWQTAAVRAALTPIGFDDVPVTGVLCLSGAVWGWFAKPIHMGEILVTWPDRLLAEINGAALIGPAEIDYIGEHLGSQLHAKQ
jgi:hypothetical protein